MDTLPFADTAMLVSLLVNNAVLTGVMFTPSGRGVTHTFVVKTSCLESCLLLMEGV